MIKRFFLKPFRCFSRKPYKPDNIIIISVECKDEATEKINALISSLDVLAEHFRTIDDLARKAADSLQELDEGIARLKGNVRR